jgi:plastocyanin
MRSTFHWLLIFTAAAAAACGSDTAPNDGNGGNGGGAAGTVTVGNIFFRSGHNGTQNPAVDTVAAGTTVTWTWTGTGGQPHSVLSQGDPGFTSSDILTGSGMTYTFMFTAPGTYHYDCAVHGSAMTGTIVVQ